MFGEMPIECEYDMPNCLSGGGGYILGPGDVFNPPNNTRYGFDNPPRIQMLPGTGFLPIQETSTMPQTASVSNGDTVVNSLVSPNIQTIATGHPLLVLGIIAGVIYLVTR